MLNTTFVSHASPLGKVFHGEKVTPCSPPKNLTSNEIYYPLTLKGLTDRFKQIQTKASKGMAMLKGPLTCKLHNESRAGKCDTEARTQTIMFDIDGLEAYKYSRTSTPYSRSNIKEMAEYFINLLPAQFQDTSYIAHASSSMGRSPGKISMHIEFHLSKPIAPRVLRNYLTSLNFSIGDLEAGIGLSASGSALTFPLDTSLAENSRMIYIANPIFIGTENPVNEDARFIQVFKDNLTCDIHEAAIKLKPKEIERLKRATIKRLRKEKGLPETKFRMDTLHSGSESIFILNNPDSLNMTYYSESEEFVSYNVGDGDSHGYYVKKSDPRIVWNFKDEPPFKFEKADPYTYKWHLKNFPIDTNKENELHFVFRDFYTNEHFNGIYDSLENKIIRIAPTSKSNISDFFKQNNGLEPDYIEYWDYEFKPSDKRLIDIRNCFLNKYEEPIITREPTVISSLLHNCNYGDAADALAVACPYIHNTIFGALGSDPASFEHFINWLAFIVQKKNKTGTAWVITGVSGTGKGVLFNKICSPILGSRNTKTLRSDIAEDMYNGFMENSLLVFVDEFSISTKYQSDRKLLDKLKTFITEPIISIRKMRENAVDRENYSNFILASNATTPILLEGFDRRFNMSPRQTKSLEELYPGYSENFEESIKVELPTFASFLTHYLVDARKAKTVLQNDTVADQKDSSRSDPQVFGDSIKKGDLSYLCDIFGLDSFMNGVSEARNIVTAMLRRPPNMVENSYMLASRNAWILYKALVDNSISQHKFSRKMKECGLTTENVRIQGRQVKSYKLAWTIDLDNLRHLQLEHLSFSDIEVTKNPLLIEEYKVYLPELWKDKKAS